MYSQLEKTAKIILMKNKIDKPTAKTFIETIDHLLRFEDDSVKKIIGKKEYQKLNQLLTKCAMHLIQISKMTVKDALIEINTALDEYLSKDDSELDIDTRFAITFFESFGYSERPFGDAEGLAKARNVSVEGVVRAGILSSKSPSKTVM